MSWPSSHFLLTPGWLFLPLSREGGEMNLAILTDSIFILQTIHGVTPGGKGERKKVVLTESKTRTFKNQQLVRKLTDHTKKLCFVFLWLFLGCTMRTTNVKQTTKEIRGVRKDVEARREQAFLGLPQRRAECDRTVFASTKESRHFHSVRERTCCWQGEWIESFKSGILICLGKFSFSLQPKVPLI